jgi:hypothetical protein
MNPWIKALQDHYVARISENIATLNVYLNTSVGVGDHPDIFNTILTLVDKIDDADSKLSTLEKYINVKPQQTSDDQTTNS